MTFFFWFDVHSKHPYNVTSMHFTAFYQGMHVLSDDPCNICSYSVVHADERAKQPQLREHLNNSTEVELDYVHHTLYLATYSTLYFKLYYANNTIYGVIQYERST